MLSQPAIGRGRGTVGIPTDRPVIAAGGGEKVLGQAGPDAGDHGGRVGRHRAGVDLAAGKQVLAAVAGVHALLQLRVQVEAHEDGEHDEGTGGPGELVRLGHGDAPPLRKGDTIEKCTFCHHRTLNGLQPACVEVCPTQARIFGDQDDPNSEISKVLKAKKSFRLKEEKRTRPNVHYVGKYTQRG